MLLRDLSAHGIVRASGPDRVRFLNGMFTNDVASLAPGRGLHAAMLTVKGKLLGDALIFREVGADVPDEGAFLVDVVAEAADKVRAALERHLIVDDVTLEERVGALGVLGEGAREALSSLLDAALPSEPYAIVRVGDRAVACVRSLGLEELRVYGDTRALAAELSARGARPLDEREAEALRIAAGEPRYGVDMGEDVLPLEARLDDAVSMTKGCYMGQEVIARLTARGHINKRLCGLRLDGDRPAEPGARISGPGRDDAGAVTSSALSPSLGPIALGYVHRSLWAPGTALTVHETAGARAATIVELPIRG
jgi:folate-binding protein YgfZ